MDTFVQFETQYINQDNEISHDYVSLLPKKVTLDRTYRAIRFPRDYRTIFREVRIVPIKEAETPQMKRLWEEPTEIIDETEEKMFSRIFAKFKDVVVKYWKPNINHIVLHSSGLDSRFMSWALMELREERGSDWLGNVLFLCTTRESSVFKNIMKYEGWEPQHYYVPDEGVRPDELHAFSLTDFKNAWFRNNGVTGFPLNFFWYLPERAILDGKLNDPVQTFHTQWGNTCLDCINGQEYRKSWARFYPSALCSRPTYGIETIRPFANIDLATAVYRSSNKLGKSLRPALIESIDVGLSKFQNMHFNDDQRLPVSRRLWSSIINDYLDSWYGKNVAPKARPDQRVRNIDFQEFWSHWTAASLCEYLLENGYEIN